METLSTAFSLVARATSQLLEKWKAASLECLPLGFRSWLAARHAALVVDVDGTGATVHLERGENRTFVSRQVLGEPSSLRNLLGPLLKFKPEVVIRLPAAAVIARRVELPAQVRRNLRSALEFELDRLTPFRAERVYFDYRFLAGDPRRGKIVAELIACLREDVNRWVAHLREEGAAASVVTWEGAWPSANLLPPAERRHSDYKERRARRVLSALVLVLAAAAALTPLWQKRQHAIMLTGAVAELRPKVERASALRSRVEKVREQVELALTQKSSQPRLVDLLRELTERVPDDTYVQNLEYNRGSTQLRGESGQATALIGILESAPGMDGVTFQSPVVQVPNSGKDRFHISLQYVRPSEE